MEGATMSDGADNQKNDPPKEEEPDRILNCSGNPFDILQLKETADLDTIRKTYRKVVQRNIECSLSSNAALPDVVESPS